MRITVLSKPFSLSVALLWVVLGIDSNHVPYFPHYVWPISFLLIALGIVHTTFQPDLSKLRLITALSAGTGMIRGIAIAIDQGRPGPAAGWLLISMLSVAYYLARRDWLPEHYREDEDDYS